MLLFYYLLIQTPILWVNTLVLNPQHWNTLINTSILKKRNWYLFYTFLYVFVLLQPSAHCIVIVEHISRFPGNCSIYGLIISLAVHCTLHRTGTHYTKCHNRAPLLQKVSRWHGTFHFRGVKIIPVSAFLSHFLWAYDK